MHNITFVIFTYNEEKRIERVIKNFENYGKILIADNKSTDRTADIARAYGCDIYIREKHYVYVENQELVDAMFPQITTDWVYWGFADEMLEKKTLLKIQEVIDEDKYSIINMDRKNYFYGSFCFNVHNSYTYKIFKKGAIDFSNNVIHGMGTATVSPASVYKMPDDYFIHHFISNNAASYLNVINRYTDVEAEFNTPSRTSFFYFIFLIAKGSLKDFLWKGGYRAGYKGLALIQLMICYHLIKYMKIFEKKERLTPASIEDSNNINRDMILKDLAGQ